MDAHKCSQAVANISLRAIWELRRQDVFVAHSRIQLIRLLVCMWIRVLLFLGLKGVFFNDYNFLHACLHTFFCLVTWVHIKGTKNISDDNNASGKIKRGILSLCFATAFCYQLTSVAGCPHTKQCAQSWRTHILDKYSQTSFLFESMCLYSMNFWDCWTLLIERERENGGNTAWDRWTPHPSININLPALHFF